MSALSQIQHLRDTLFKLAESHGISGLKTGTEVEDMGFDEIAFLAEVAREIVPVTLKIGGPEARNDMRKALSLEISTILAPMIETLYALTNFVETATELLLPYDHAPALAINIESFTAIQNFDQMLESKAASVLSQVTVGRSDLSRSMHLPIDDPEVTAAALSVIKKVNNRSLISSLGGGLSLENITHLTQQLPPVQFNTRHTIFRNSPGFRKNPAARLYQGLLFEEQLYSTMSEVFPDKREHYLKRAEILSRRMNGMKLIEKRG